MTSNSPKLGEGNGDCVVSLCLLMASLAPWQALNKGFYCNGQFYQIPSMFTYSYLLLGSSTFL